MQAARKHSSGEKWLPNCLFKDTIAPGEFFAVTELPDWFKGEKLRVRVKGDLFFPFMFFFIIIIKV